MTKTRASRLTRIVVVASALTLGAAACTSDDPPPRASGGFLGLRSAPVALQSDRDCAAVLDDFQTFAEPVMVDSFAGVGFGLDDTAGTTAVAASESATDGDRAAGALPATGDNGGGTGGDSSQTNTQEEGIDEPDVVENDGTNVYVVDGSELVVLDGATAAVLSRTELGTWGAQLLLQDDRLLVISGGGYAYAVAEDVAVAAESDPATGAAEPSDEGKLIAPDQDPDAGTTEPSPMPTDPPEFAAGTIVQLFDVSDPASPAIVETTELEGYHVATRVVGGVARVVVSTYPEFHTMPMPAVASDGAESSRIALADQVEQQIDETTIDDWLPQFRTTAAGDDPVQGSAVSCESVFVPEVNAGVTETSVMRFDFDGGFDPAETTTVVAETATVYASPTTLYLAANRWIPFEDQAGVAAEEFRTALHAFDLSGDGAAAHIGAGDIAGTVLNQYSLSEFEGHLRVATTEGTPWDERTASQSGVRVLRLEGAVLTEVGSVSGLGLTETIQSVRFMGPVAYVVTFRQTDPLYVIDLSDPGAPRAVGELKIPGFSSYLHPTEPGRLVGIGRDADEEGVDQGLLISLFDVTDPTAPRQIQTWTDREAWSNAGFDPKAFLYWAPESALAIPFERYSTVSEPVAEAEAREIEAREAEGDTGSGTSGSGGTVEPAPAPDEPDGTEPAPSDDVATDIAPAPNQELGIMVLDIDDGGITERGLVRADGRYPSRALVVQGRLWSLFEGGVAVSDFGSVASAIFHAYR